MKQRTLLALLTTSLLTLGAFSCVGDDPATSPNTPATGGSPDGGGGNGNDGSPSNNTTDAEASNDGGGDDAATPPHVPIAGHYLKSTHPKLSYSFGGSIAMSADGNTVAVGSEREASTSTGINSTTPGPDGTGAADSGAVFVFVRSAGVWTQQAYIKASNTAANARFGCSVSLSSDGSRLAVGAKGESGTANSNGAVYFFQRSGGSTWAQIGPVIRAGAPMQSAEFGTSVALSGDGNALAVGSFNESGTSVGIVDGASAGGTFTGLSTFRGAVNVFTYSGANWSQTHYIKPSIMQDGARFGSSVALNGSGSILIVGSQGENSGVKGVSTSASSDVSASGAGAAYVFEKNLGSWSQIAYVKPANTRAGARFGISVSTASNGESFVVGSNFETSGAKGVNSTAPGPDDTTATNSGAAYVFNRTNGIWSQTAYVKASNTRGNSYFGSAVAMSIDGKSLIVGSSSESSAAMGVNPASPGQEDTSLASSGAAYVFALVGGAWQQTAYLKAFRTARSRNFGSAVAIANNASNIAVGASTDPSSDTGVDGTKNDTGAANSGAAFTFE